VLPMAFLYRTLEYRFYVVIFLIRDSQLKDSKLHRLKNSPLIHLY
jgi:hypothetical protein